MGFLLDYMLPTFVLHSFAINITAPVSSLGASAHVCACACVCACVWARVHKGGHEHVPFYMGPITEYNLYVSCVVLSYRSASRSWSHHVRAVHQLSERSQNGTYYSIFNFLQVFISTQNILPSLFFTQTQTHSLPSLSFRTRVTTHNIHTNNTHIHRCV